MEDIGLSDNQSLLVPTTVYMLCSQCKKFENLRKIDNFFILNGNIFFLHP